MGRLRTLTTALAVATCGMAGGAPAVADVELGRPGQLRPVPSPKGDNPRSPSTEATQQSGLFQCSVSYATVANVPGGYAIGNCPYGKYLYRTMKSDFVSTPPAGYFDGGYIDGPFDGCGWIFESYSNKVAERNNTGCSSPSRPTSDFTDWTNCASPCTDASQFDNAHDCPVYANYRPWSTNNRPTGYMHTIRAHERLADGSFRLAWRYVTKYASADGSGHYVMIRDRGKSAGQGNWGFVPWSCF